MRVPTGPAIAALAVVGALAACVEETPSPHPGVVDRDSAGVRIVTPTSAADAERRTLALDARWPSATGLSFGELVDLEVTSSGHVALLDRMTVRITILSPDGAVEAEFGRAGEGPGELSPYGLFNVVSMDSTILVPDIQLQRITEFSLSGEVVATHGTIDSPSPGPGAYAVDWRAHPSGGFAARVMTVEQDAVVRLDGNVLDTLYVQPLEREHNMLIAPSLVWDIDRDGRIVAARSDLMEIRLWDVQRSEYVWIARENGSERPLSGRDRDHLGALMIGVMEEETAGRLPDSERAAILATVSFPPHAPVISSLHVSSDGQYWVRETLPVPEMNREAMRIGTADGVGARDWRVLGRDGSLVEIVRLPERFHPRRFVGPWIYGIREDEMGVQSVARVRNER